MASYVPRILLCGDVNSFRGAVKMPVEVVGKISFIGSPEHGDTPIFARDKDELAFVPKELRIFLDGVEISVDALKKILEGTADYIVFNDDKELIGRHYDLISIRIIEQVLARDNLFRQARRNFYAPSNFHSLAKILRDNKIFRLLDVDALFAETDFFMFDDLFNLKIDAVNENAEPIHENFYGKIYRTLDDCKFKFFDALLIAERSPENFIDALIETDGLADVIVTFARKNSALEKFLSAQSDAFEKIFATPVINGNWYVIQKRVPKNFCVYVVTHKDAKLDELPEGYRIIHAGHAQAAETFGDVTDDTGDNISTLNLYLNEVTALYWMWKNTSHDVIGLNHYRRFFTASNDTSFAVEKILSRSQAEEILRDYDIIVTKCKLSRLPVSYWQMMVSGSDIEQFVNEIFRKHIAARQPNYLDAFEQVAQSFTGIQYEIFITRRKIFDAYCEWLFSFLPDVTDEVFARTNIRQIDNPRKYRIISFFAERLMTVWLRKNRVRIKQMPVMFRANV